jgi:hypothetical protein
MEIEVLIDPNHSGIKPTCNGVVPLPRGGRESNARIEVTTA